MNSQRCLVFDIETRPMKVFVWQLGEQRVTLEQIDEDWSVIAFAAKWLDAPVNTIMYADTRQRSEKDLLEKIWDLLDQADIVITQNGQRFDSRKLNARFIEYGMKPPSPYKHLDTYKIADKVAEFTSHKLEYLTDKLNKKYKKLSHKKYPGLKLWKECLKGNVDAWNEMKKYNIHDVLSTEELYNNLKAWTPPSMPTRADIKTACRVCGKLDRMWHKGYEIKKTGKYYRFQCQRCFAWTTGEKMK